MNNYLILTAAHIDKSRNADYLNSITSVLQFKNRFEKIFLLECVSKKPRSIGYLNQFAECVISPCENQYPNKGVNEFIHINNFLRDRSEIKDDDTIVKLTGRYLLKNDSFLNILPLQNDIIAKPDGDIWDSITGNCNRGVHTFYFAFKKRAMNPFIEHLKQTGKINSSDPIEWILKDYMPSVNSAVYKGEMGVITNFALNGLKVFT